MPGSGCRPWAAAPGDAGAGTGQVRQSPELLTPALRLSFPPGGLRRRSLLQSEPGWGAGKAAGMLPAGWDSAHPARKVSPAGSGHARGWRMSGWMDKTLPSLRWKFPAGVQDVPFPRQAVCLVPILLPEDTAIPQVGMHPNRG